MNNGLGINFFRYLKEEDEQFWVQVFAKLPFDDVELAQKGALFGIVKLKKTESWSEIDMELTAWVDEYFNGLEKPVDLSDFYVSLGNKFSVDGGVWLSLFAEGGNRRMRAIGTGGLTLNISRGGVEISLSKSLSDSRILSGELKIGDTVTFGVCDFVKIKDEDLKLEELNSSSSFGCFRVEILDVSNPIVEVVETVEDNKNTETDQIEPIVEEKVLAVETPIATDKYIGKVSVFNRLRNLFQIRRNSLIVANEEQTVKRKKVAFLMGLCFVALLAVSLVFGGIKKAGQQKENNWIEFSGPIEKALASALEVSKINSSGAKKMVEEARQKFLTGKNEFTDVEKTTALEKRIEDAWVLVSGEKNAEFTEAVNLELIRAGVNASKISHSSKDLFSVISAENGLVMSVVLGNKEMKVLAGKGAGLGWVDSVISKDKAYVLTKGGVFVAGNEANSLIFDTAVTDPVGLSLFGSNLYILEKGNKEIFKYSITDSGFGERQRWLKEGQIIANTPVDMDIDVDVWVLEQGGVLERFRRGLKESFVLTGLPKEIEPERVSVEIEGDKIALLAPKQSVVVICSKETGVCDKQLKNQRLNEAKDIAFGEQGALYVLLKGSVGVLN